MNLICENFKTILIFYFSRLLIIIFASGTILNSAEAAGQEQFNLVKIHVAEVENIEEMEADAAAMKRSNRLKTFSFRRVFNLSPGFRWAIVTDNDIEFLEERGYDVEFVMKGVETELHKRVVWGEEMVLPEGYLPYAEICTKKESYLIQQSLNHLEERLNPNQFIRVHRSFIVNIDAIRDIVACSNSRYKLYLKDQQEIFVSRSGYKKLMRFTV